MLDRSRQCYEKIGGCEQSNFRSHSLVLDAPESLITKYCFFLHSFIRNYSINELNELTFAAIGPGELTPPATYQGGDIILLEAKVRYGKISYEDEDVLQRERGWRPSVKLEADVETDLKSYPVLTVTFYQTGDGSITYKYDKLKPSPSTSDWGIWRFMVTCCGILAQCFRDIWGWCRGR